MNRASLNRRLASAEKHIAEVTRLIDHQSQLLRGLARLGQDTAQARRLLENMEESVRLHRAARDKLLSELYA
jgi:hypothetical protein